MKEDVNLSALVMYSHDKQWAYFLEEFERYITRPDKAGFVVYHPLATGMLHIAHGLDYPVAWEQHGDTIAGMNTTTRRAINMPLFTRRLQFYLQLATNSGEYFQGKGTVSAEAQSVIIKHMLYRAFSNRDSEAFSLISKFLYRPIPDYLRVPPYPRFVADRFANTCYGVPDARLVPPMLRWGMGHALSPTYPGLEEHLLAFFKQTDTNPFLFMSAPQEPLHAVDGFHAADYAGELQVGEPERRASLCYLRLLYRQKRLAATPLQSTAIST